MSERDRPLRIGLLTHSVNPRGGVVHTLELATALHAAGHAVTVMAPAAPGQAMFRTPPCRVELAPVNDTPRDTVGMVRSRIDAFVGHLHGLLQRETFDVLHTQDSIGGNALLQLQDEGRIDGFVRTVHHLDTFDDPQLTRWQRNAFERASLVLSGSRLWCEHLKSEYGVQAHEIDNGVDTLRFSPIAQAGDASLAQRLGIATGAPVVLAIGGIEERKNSARLLAGFALLRAAHPRAQLVIAGGASLLDHGAYAETFRAQMQALGFDDCPMPTSRRSIAWPTWLPCPRCAKASASWCSRGLPAACPWLPHASRPSPTTWPRRM
jgi:glycosyltransferase-like protein